MGTVRGYRVHYQCYIAHGTTGTERFSCLNPWYSKASHGAYADGILTLQSPVVTICTTSLTFTNSTFCPHSVFMSCVDLKTNSDYFPIQH